MRLIDADATLDLLKSLGSRDYRRSKGTIIEAEKMLMYEEYTPTIDADSVRHGHWEHDGTGANFCSECDKYPYDDGEYHLVWHTDYCPHCGAKMDEVSE